MAGSISATVVIVVYFEVRNRARSNVYGSQHQAGIPCAYLEILEEVFFRRPDSTDIF